jgi:hypothetical protein
MDERNRGWAATARAFGAFSAALAVVVALTNGKVFAGEPGGILPVGQVQEQGQKNPYIAVALAVGAPGLLGAGAAVAGKKGALEVSLATAAAAATLAPSAGHIYTGEYLHAAGTAGARTALLGVSTLVFAENFSYSGDRLDKAETAVLLVSFLGWAGMVVYDFVDAPFSAIRYNEKRLALPKAKRLSVFPVILPSGPTNDEPSALGLAVSGHF